MLRHCWPTIIRPLSILHVSIRRLYHAPCCIVFPCAVRRRLSRILLTDIPICACNKTALSHGKLASMRFFTLILSLRQSRQHPFFSQWPWLYGNSVSIPFCHFGLGFTAMFSAPPPFSLWPRLYGNVVLIPCCQHPSFHFGKVQVRFG